jgi:hypothetical protein
MSTSITHSPACDRPTGRRKLESTDPNRVETVVVALQVYAKESKIPVPHPRDRLTGLERGTEMELERFVADVERRATAITPTLRGILESSGREVWPQWGINE